MKKIGFMGFGAIGATFGTQMINQKYPIKVLVDEGRLERYKNKGVIVNDISYNFDVETPLTATEKLDIIFISVKYNQLDEASIIMKSFVNEETVIVSLLNGIDSEEILSKYFNKNQIVHAYVVAIDALRIGHAISYTNQGKIILGAGFKEASEKISLITEVLVQGGIAYEVKEDILKALWWKYMVNVGINQVSAILRAPYGLFQKNTYAQRLMIGSMNEVIAISKKTGVGLGLEAIDVFNEILATLGEEMKTSMLQDVEAKRKTEVDMLAGKMIELGKKHNVPVPINEMLYDMLKAIEANYVYL